MAKKDKGFTIIEVALVLAIAGLIFLVVFLALPALQRGQRDTARRQDAGRIVSAMQSCLADNQGSLQNCNTVSQIAPYIKGATGSSQSALSQITALYVDGSYTTKGEKTAPVTDDNTGYLIKTPATNGGAKYTTATIVMGRICSGNSTTATGTDPARNAAVLVSIESGTKYCTSL